MEGPFSSVGTSPELQIPPPSQRQYNTSLKEILASIGGKRREKGPQALEKTEKELGNGVTLGAT